MRKVKHPCSGLSLTPAQKRWFEQLCAGYEGGPPSQKAAETLNNYGLVERLSDKVLGRDRFGVISVPQWQATSWAHMQFCQWAAQFENDT